MESITEGIVGAYAFIAVLSPDYLNSKVSKSPYLKGSKVSDGCGDRSAWRSYRLPSTQASYTLILTLGNNYQNP